MGNKQLAEIRARDGQWTPASRQVIGKLVGVEATFKDVQHGASSDVSSLPTKSKDYGRGRATFTVNLPLDWTMATSEELHCVWVISDRLICLATAVTQLYVGDAFPSP